jgi:hypothetical protein
MIPTVDAGRECAQTVFESLRPAIGLVKDARDASGGGTEQQAKAIDTALATASSTASITEAEIAKVLGYELCKCEFPPTPMLAVGYFDRRTQPERKALRSMSVQNADTTLPRRMSTKGLLRLVLPRVSITDRYWEPKVS